MIHKIALWQKIGFFFTIGFGVLLHFLYEWSNESIWIAPFSGVNESTWEHMKLLFFPMFLFAVVQSFFFKYYKNFWTIKLKGILLGLLLIPLLFYFYNGVIGKSPDWVNILIFMISTGCTYIYETKNFNKKDTVEKESNSSFVLVLFIGVMFVLFTFKPLDLSIFQDPNTGSYGIDNFVSFII